jgi:hypothetical protein
MPEVTPGHHGKRWGSSVRVVYDERHIAEVTLNRDLQDEVAKR